MRHRVKGKKLSRTTPHRKATLRALSSALIKEHRIETTLAKAKALRVFIEPLITTAKVDNSHNRRKVFSSLQDKHAVSELFDTIGPASAERPGGYTRVLKLGFRLGDSAEMAVIELVDFNDVPPEKRSSKKKRTRRAGRSNKPVSDAPEDAEQQEEAAPKPEAKADVKEEPVKSQEEETDNTEKTPSAEEKETAEDPKKESASPAKGEAEETAEDKEDPAEGQSEDSKKKEG